MEALFLKILNMSLTGAVVILAVLLVRLALRKAPKVFSYALWAVVLFRLLCPFTIESAFSPLPSVQTRSDEKGQTVLQVHTGILALNGPINDYLGDHPYQGGKLDAAPELPEAEQSSAAGRSGRAPDWRAALAAVWLGGCALVLGYGLISLLRLRRRLVGALPLPGEKNVRLADHIPSPFVLGLLRPRIYLPSGLPEAERDYILLHERTHIRRGDHVLRALAWLALAVHWFNPLVWAAFHLAGQDMEMSCDEAVLRRMGRDVRADYSASLLRLSAEERLPVGPLAFGDGNPKSRIQNVLNWKKPALWVVAAALIGVVCVGAALATSRGGGDPQAGAGLTFLLEETEEGQPYVLIGGTARGCTLEEDTIWWPGSGETLFEKIPDRHLMMQYTFECGWGRVFAWWADGSRTRVTVSTQADTIAISSIVDWWEFTVDLSGAGTVASMEVMGRNIEQGLSRRVMPESITDEEAVALARIAAELLTAAEDWYRSQPDGANDLSAELTLSMAGEGMAVRMNGAVDGVAQKHAMWFAPAWYEQYEEESLTCPLGKLWFEAPLCDGEVVCTLDACWTDESRSAVKVTATPRAMISSYAPSGNLIFTAALGEDGGTLQELEGYVPKLAPGPELVPTEAEAVTAARIAAKLLTAAEDYYNNALSNPSPAPKTSPPERVWAWGGGGDAPNQDLEGWARDNGISYRFSQRDIDDAIAAVRATLEEEWAKEEWVISFEVTNVYEARLETLNQWRMYFCRTSELFADWTQEDMETRYIVIGAEFTCEYDHTLTFMNDGRQRAAIALTRAPGGEWSVLPGATSLKPAPYAG